MDDPLSPQRMPNVENAKRCRIDHDLAYQVSIGVLRRDSIHGVGRRGQLRLGSVGHHLQARPLGTRRHSGIHNAARSFE
jgi:hypothetical protein